MLQRKTEQVKTCPKQLGANCIEKILLFAKMFCDRPASWISIENAYEPSSFPRSSRQNFERALPIRLGPHPIIQAMAEQPPENLKETEEMNRNGSSSTPNQFQGTQFGKTNHVTGEVWKVSYEKQTLERLTKAIEDIAVEHGFGPVDATAILCSVHGVGEDEVHLSRRILKEHEKHLLPNDLSSHFLSRDRIFIRSLLGVIFCKSLFSARGWEAIGLDEVVENVVFDHESGRSKLEMSYFTCMHEDDRINVIIEGHGKNSAAFSFRHYRYWVEKRLLVSSKDFVSHRIDADVA